MSTKCRILTVPLLSCLILLSACAQGEPAAPAQPQAEPQASVPPPPPPTPEEIMAAYEKAGTPGPQHAWLAKLAGTWNVEAKIWMGPGEPQTSTGKAEMKMILGGRFLEQRYDATFMDQPMSGVGYCGYDNLQGKFSSVWMDSTSTFLYFEEGSLDAEGKVLATTSQHLDPATKATVKGRSVSTLVDPDRYLVEMYETPSGGTESKVLELTYRRVK